MPATGDNNLTITHPFDASRAVVWDLSTDARHLAEWWSPEGFTIPTCDADLQLGGRIKLDIQGPDSKVYPMAGEYREVLKLERLVFITTPLDEAGKPLFEVLNTAVFSERGAKTILRLELRVLA